ncbi:LxmA leader domain family RiPP [Streptomyces sp. NRRL S-920]|uniref:LxmA leader domain family RiPP n=1 Tax=Streptomyces sp. NRRL S-920 TaxID=1463921 RepID=UPI0004CC39F2|nr:LxmA leader domain family RiPP [Streptomyces sp. NRRL S-920]
MQVVEVPQFTDTADTIDTIDTIDTGELFAGYRTYTDAGELDSVFGQEEATAATVTIISTATIIVSCLC